jgi:hypothetical protein
MARLLWRLRPRTGRLDGFLARVWGHFSECGCGLMPTIDELISPIVEIRTSCLSPLEWRTSPPRLRWTACILRVPGGNVTILLRNTILHRPSRHDFSGDLISSPIEHPLGDEVAREAHSGLSISLHGQLGHSHSRNQNKFPSHTLGRGNKTATRNEEADVIDLRSVCGRQVAIGGFADFPSIGVPPSPPA